MSYIPIFSSIMYAIHSLRLYIVLTLTTGFLLTVSTGADGGSTALKKWWKQFSTSYPNHQRVSEIFDEMQKVFPTLAKKYSIGQSVNQSDLWVINIAENVNKPRPLLRPMVKIVANIHGDEALGRALSLMLATKLLQGYHSKEPRIMKLLKNTDIHILFSANPDGFAVSVEGRCQTLKKAKGRRNANGVDLNRNFPDQFYPDKTPSPQIETTHLMKWITGNPFVLSASLHGGAIVASYPFDSLSPEVILGLKSYPHKGVPSLSPDNDVFLHLAKLYANTHPNMGTQSGDQNQNLCEKNNFKETGGITNGADWYNVQGGMQDYNYVHSNCFEITFELSCCKYPKGTELQGMNGGITKRPSSRFWKVLRCRMSEDSCGGY